jgi:hypothetical protein
MGRRSGLKIRWGQKPRPGSSPGSGTTYATSLCRRFSPLYRFCAHHFAAAVQGSDALKVNHLDQQSLQRCTSQKTARNIPLSFSGSACLAVVHSGELKKFIELVFCEMVPGRQLGYLLVAFNALALSGYSLSPNLPLTPPQVSLLVGTGVPPGH